jgi:protein-L-isoaspartate(D-aspartate) O-methyltransferase
MEDREEMVTHLIERRGVTDLRVLKAMQAVPRHLFVPLKLQRMAYMDGPLPIGGGQTISQPYIVGLMTQLAEVGPEDKVLEIGTGSGYQAAVLAELTDKVFTIEILPELVAQAANRLKSLGYTQVRLRTGDGYAGWPEEAPFDAILVTAAPEKVPQPLTDQLAEGGVLVMPLGPSGGYQELICIRKKEGKLEQETVTSVSFVPLIRGKASED